MKRLCHGVEAIYQDDAIDLSNFLYFGMADDLFHRGIFV